MSRVSFKSRAIYLIHELSLYYTAECDQILLERYGIGYSQFKVLLMVEETPGISQKQIALNLKQTQASVSRQIGILIDKDLIEIGPAKDNRQHLIYLTPRGEEMVQKTTTALESYDSYVLRKMTDKQKAEFISILKDLR